MDFELDDDNHLTNPIDELFTIKWEYTLFNGVFSDDNKVKKTPKIEIDRCIKETVRFLDKTFSNEFINDINESRDLQQQILKQYREI